MSHENEKSGSKIPGLALGAFLFTILFLVAPSWVFWIVAVAAALWFALWVIGHSIVEVPKATKMARTSFGRRVSIEAGGVKGEGLRTKIFWEEAQQIPQTILTFTDEIRIMTGGAEGDGDKAEALEVKFPTFVKYRKDPGIADSSGRPRVLEVDQTDTEHELAEAAETVAATVGEAYRLEEVLRHKPQIELMYECALRLEEMPHEDAHFPGPKPLHHKILHFYLEKREEVMRWLRTHGRAKTSEIEKWNGVEVLQAGIGAPILPERIKSQKEEVAILDSYGSQVDALAKKLKDHGVPADVVERRVAASLKLGGEMTDTRVNGLEGLVGSLLNKMSGSGGGKSSKGGKS